MWVCLKMGYTPNEIAIFCRDNDQQHHWVFRGTQHFQTNPYQIMVISMAWWEMMVEMGWSMTLWWTFTVCNGKIHHAINGKIHYFDWAIFNCYVSSPEGKSMVIWWLYDGYMMVIWWLWWTITNNNGDHPLEPMGIGADGCGWLIHG